MTDSGLTMADFTDCIVEGPWYGEEGYIGDYPQPLEYPCNCRYCRREWEESVGILVREDDLDSEASERDVDEGR